MWPVAILQEVFSKAEWGCLHELCKASNSIFRCSMVLESK